MILQNKKSKEMKILAKDFIYVSGGEIKIIKNNGVCQEFNYKVNPFWIQKSCVSAKEFQIFNQAEKEYANDLPVTGMKISQAEKYALWLSKKLDIKLRLPTEWEWTMAAYLFGNKESVNIRFDLDAKSLNYFSNLNYPITLMVNQKQYAITKNIFEIMTNGYNRRLKFLQPKSNELYVVKGQDIISGFYGQGEFKSDFHSSRVGFRLVCPCHGKGG